MYAPYFGLRQAPFSIAPDPRYLYMSERHREALAHLLYGLGGGGGFVVLTGEIGAGKTTVCRCLLEQVPPGCRLAYIVNPKLSAIELLQSICEEFGIAVRSSSPPTVKDYIDPLNRRLLEVHAAGGQSVLVIDEAQNLAPEVLEQLRLLTNLETDERKLLQILLIGQPELRELLARPQLEQLAQRVIARYHLGALGASETRAYIAHRLAVAGGAQPFEPAALDRVHRLARGVPRRINLLCDRALLGAYAQGQPRIGRRIVERAAREVFDDSAAGRRPGAFRLATAAAVVLLAGFALWTYEREPHRPAPRAGAASAPAPTTGAAAGAAAGELESGDAAALYDALPRDADRAWRELALDWGWSSRDGDPCAAAPAHGLRCLRGGGATLALLRLLDRPVLLALSEAGAPVRQARLIGLDERRALFAVGARRWVITRDELARFWRGGYATYWRAPAGYTAPLAPGASGAAVDALAADLARLRDQPAPPSGQHLAGELAAELAAFQLAQGLQSDGIAGATTFIRLNRSLGVDEPRLAATSER